MTPPSRRSVRVRSAYPLPLSNLPVSHRDYGGAALLLLLVGVLASSMFAKVVDGSRIVTDPHGTSISIASGNVGGVAGVAFMLLATACAALTVASFRRTRPVVSAFAVAMLLLISWWGTTVTLLQGNSMTGDQLVTLACGTLLALGVLIAPPGLDAVRHLDLLRDVTAGALLVYAIAFPESGQLPCRADKCGIFNSLLVGFMAHENAAAAMVVTLTPLVLAQQTMRRTVVSVGLAASVVLGTGSRTALAVLVVSIAYAAYCRRLARTFNTKPNLVWRVLPLAGFAVSTLLFLFATPETFTGRGLLFWAMREQLHGTALIVGSGPDTMQRAALLLGGFTSVGEHGQAPHLLVWTGLVGWFLFATALLSLALTRTWSTRRLVALGLAVAAAVQGITEPAWILEVRTSGFVALLLAIGLMCRCGRSEGPMSPADSWSRRAKQALQPPTGSR